jgi:hypothetical protein
MDGMPDSYVYSTVLPVLYRMILLAAATRENTCRAGIMGRRPTNLGGKPGKLGMGMQSDMSFSFFCTMPYGAAKHLRCTVV